MKDGGAAGVAETASEIGFAFAVVPLRLLGHRAKKSAC